MLKDFGSDFQWGIYSCYLLRAHVHVHAHAHVHVGYTGRFVVGRGRRWSDGCGLHTYFRIRRAQRGDFFRSQSAVLGSKPRFSILFFGGPGDVYRLLSLLLCFPIPSSLPSDPFTLCTSSRLGGPAIYGHMATRLLFCWSFSRFSHSSEVPSRSGGLEAPGRCGTRYIYVSPALVCSPRSELPGHIDNTMNDERHTEKKTTTPNSPIEFT